METRRYIAANDLLVDSFALSVKVFDSGFRPDFVVGLWRGGTSVGIAVQEGLEYLGAKTDHIAVRTSYAGHSEYAKRTKGKAQIDVHGLRYVIERVASSHTLLIVDDVYGTGRSVEAVIDKLRRKARRNTPHDIRVAAVWRRPVEGVRPPDYHVHETTDWLALPYELADLTPEEIAREKPAAARAIKAVLTARAERMGA